MVVNHFPEEVDTRYNNYNNNSLFFVEYSSIKEKGRRLLPFWVYLQRCSFVQLIPNGAVDKINN